MYASFGSNQVGRTQSRQERQRALGREGVAGGGRERERRTCSRCCAASRGQRVSGMPPEVWRGGNPRSSRPPTLRRVSGSNGSRAAVRRAVVARWREGAHDGGARGRGLMLWQGRGTAATYIRRVVILDPVLPHGHERQDSGRLLRQSYFLAGRGRRPSNGTDLFGACLTCHVLKKKSARVVTCS